MKVSDQVNTIQPTSSSKKLLENLAGIALSQLKDTKVLDQIKEWQVMGKISPKQAFDMRKTVLRIQHLNIQIAPSELMQELDKKN